MADEHELIIDGQPVIVVVRGEPVTTPVYVAGITGCDRLGCDHWPGGLVRCRVHEDADGTWVCHDHSCP